MTSRKIADIALVVLVTTWVGYVGYQIWSDRTRKPGEIIISHSVAPPPDVVP